MKKMNSRININSVMYALVCISIFSFLIISLFLYNEAERPQIHSSALHLLSREDGNTITEYYVDDLGHISYAADKHYAYIVKTDSPNKVLEKYYDEKGNQAIQQQGYYAIENNYNERNECYKTTYLDQDCNPVSISTGYSSIVRQFNEKGQVIYEYYFDSDGNPVLTDYMGHCRYNGYDNDGCNTYVKYFDLRNDVTLVKSGFAVAKRSFYKSGSNKGKVKKEFYFDTSEQPIALSTGEYGVIKDYDAFGRIKTLSFLDENGNLTSTKRGYTTVRRTFYPDDTVETEMYYDVNGNQIALSDGQYGVRHKNGKTIYLDKNGREHFSINNWLYSHSVVAVIIAIFVIIISATIDKYGNMILIVLYLLFIAYMTLMYRTEADARAEWELFWSYKQFLSSTSLRLEILNNIWLFIPLGAMLYRLCPKAYILIVPLALSVIIEAVQYLTGVGLAEIDDVISNGLGGVIGCGFEYALVNFLSFLSAEKVPDS